MACARYVLLLSFCHADFADNADFSSWCFFVPQISQINTDLYEIKNLRHLRNLREKTLTRKICVHLWNLWDIFQSQGGISTDRIGRFRVNPWVIASAGNLRLNSVWSDEQKSAWQKNSDEKIIIRWRKYWYLVIIYFLWQYFPWFSVY